MHNSGRHIQQELEGLYSMPEISVLTQLIFKEVCGNSFIGMTTDKISHLSGPQRRKTEDIVRRLKTGEPIQYILGKTEFYGLPFIVTPDVLIPRPETEELVEWALSGSRKTNCSVLDIGTGSGCIAVTLAKKMNKADVYAWDISEGALEVASENARLNGVSVHFLVHDIFQPVEDNPVFDVIVSNPPYVTESEKVDMEVNVLDFEPHVALFVADDNALLFYERIADIALVMLNDRGELYFEINREKGSEICNMLRDKGFESVELKKDISGNERIVRAVKPESHG
ncbi:peptide chain release factor N(5)-glutamine methyltransferase [Proteiniphilum sp.]|uniref:peptide chain release factor N(5)-glutamine methyltransferase n=1 Tax=Proteiniphilum sp. TaxID=1926877 RepID=UPI002B21CE4E|nr:peptide chain release factor N(5)-glutamine methyltransferase [Proteiniphilum sp.]MEA4916728.1 peptide chain release factor N(5)-glutamine methyltransferase [Proteiniphilum sp.]